MSERLLSVGLDVGTSTTQMILSELRVENTAGGFAVPQLQITDRKILYRSPVLFTPLLSESRVDGAALRALLERQYAAAGIRRQDVQTGAVIITGETSRKENARQVLAQIAPLAGDFVVATAGPDLESLLAAKGAGAEDYSEKTGKHLLHMDIGGGTANLAWIEKGQTVKTGCLNVGGRLIKRDPEGRVTYVSPVVADLTGIRAEQTPDTEQLKALAQSLVRGLEAAAGLREDRQILNSLWTKECGPLPEGFAGGYTVSFSGGVAACMEKAVDDNAFGDMGPILARAILESRLCQGEYRLAPDAIRATVIGAGCHSAKLSGSTVFCRDVRLPLQNLPVVKLTLQEQESETLESVIRQRLRRADSALAVVAMPGPEGGYGAVAALAERLAAALPSGPILLCLENDRAKALGQRLRLLCPQRPCRCLDGLRLQPESYLDVGAPVGPAYPVVIKTIILSQN